MEIETSLRRVREVVTRPEVFDIIYSFDSVDDYLPNPTDINFAVGDGLIIYEMHGHSAELVTAISKEDLPKNPKQEIQKQWDYLATLGVTLVYTIIHESNQLARNMARAMGMELHHGNELRIYKKVIQ